jgi:aminoglycoside 3'-phosphotransferase-2
MAVRAVRLQSILPVGWEDLAKAHVEKVTTGLSDAAVFRLTAAGEPPRYLKLGRGKAAALLRNEIARMRWLAKHNIRVAKILRIDDKPQHTILLTEAISGVPADESPLSADQLVAAVARALSALHQLPAPDCPFDESVATRLSRAAAAIAAGEVDPDAFDERNQGVAPEELFKRLAAHPPLEDMVVVHGDATLSNLIVDANGSVGFVDCGNAGRGDRYIDLAVLTTYLTEGYGPEAATDFIRLYGGRGWDADKARYFLDLYELF